MIKNFFNIAPLKYLFWHLIYIYETNKNDHRKGATMKGTNLGEFEELILLTVCVLYDNAYGVAIKEEINKQTGRALSISAVHSALHRLQAKGYVESWMGGATNLRGGRRKRYFRITNAGKEALVEMRRTREKMWNLIPNITFEGGTS